MPLKPPRIVIALDLDNTLITTQDRNYHKKGDGKYSYDLNRMLVDHLIKLKQEFKEELKIILVTCNQNEDLIRQVITDLKNYRPESCKQLTIAQDLIDEYQILNTTNKRPTLNRLIKQYKPEEVWLVDDKIYQGYLSPNERTIVETDSNMSWSEESKIKNNAGLTLSCFKNRSEFNLLNRMIKGKFNEHDFRQRTAKREDFNSLTLKKLRFIQAPYQLHPKSSYQRICCLFQAKNSWNKDTLYLYFPRLRKDHYTDENNLQTPLNPHEYSNGNAKNLKTVCYGTMGQ